MIFISLFVLTELGDKYIENLLNSSVSRSPQKSEDLIIFCEERI